MSKTEHTPGPWKISYEAINTNTLEIHGGGQCVSELNAMGVRLDNDRLFANARLIAAAPDLLAELEALNEFWTTDYPNGPDAYDHLHHTFTERWKSVRALIQKARGQA